MYVISRQQDKTTLWLTSTRPERWDEEIGQAVRFDTRGEARRAAAMIGISGDWSINVAQGVGVYDFVPVG
jgi:hypothetical protein